MRSQKPGKRWVHKGEYLGLVKQRFRHFALGCLAIIGGILLLILRIGCEQITSPPEPVVVQQAPSHLSIWGMIGLILLMLLVVLVEFHEIVFFVYQSFKAAAEVESVRVISSHNHHLAPPEECLVRASDLPSTQQRAELLRAAPPGKETPPEELLRAGQQSKPD